MFKFIPIFFLIICITTLTCCGGTDKLPAGASANAMAGISILEKNIWSAWNNQAGLTEIENIEIGWYTELPYSLSELQNSGMILAIPSKNLGTFAFNLNYFGYNLYNESVFGLAYGKKLSNNISIGIGLNYNQISISEPKGKAGAFTTEIGIQTKLSNKLSSAFHIYNPTLSTINTETKKEELPGIIKLGLIYAASEKVNVMSEIEKDFINDAIFKFSFDYSVIDNLKIKAGVHSNSFEYAFGIGYIFSGFTLDIASRYQQEIGFTPSVSIFYNFN